MSEEVTEEQIADAIAAATTNKDENASTTTSSTSSVSDDDSLTASGMVAALKKHGDGTNVIKESITTFSNPDGSDKKGDAKISADNMDQALQSLKELVQKAKDAEEKKKKKSKSTAKWDFGTSPHAQFGKTFDDTLKAFLLWARTEEEKKEINVSKAFRRLESYASWMDDTGTVLVEPPLSASSVKDALEIWQMKSSVSAKTKNLVWWFDMGAIDTEITKKMSADDSLRAFVWFSHYVMYHPSAQEEGMLVVENCDKIGFYKMITMMPMKLGTQLDRLTIGVLPVKTKKFYLLETPRWIDVFMKILGAFMSKKMKSRMYLCKDWSEIENKLGGECIPKGWGKLEGSLDVGCVPEEYASS